MDTISVVIADTKKAVRASYRRRLRQDNGIQVIGEAGTSPEVITALKLKPHILLLDWKLVVLDGTRLVPLIRQHSPDTRVILLISRLSPWRLIHAMSDGVRGYLGRATAERSLAKAVQTVYRGEVWVPRSMVPRLVAVVSHLALT